MYRAAASSRAGRGAPPSSPLYSGARKIVRVLLELLLELLEESESIGRSAGEARQQLSATQRADFLGIGFHDGLPNGHLSVASQRDLAVAPYREDCGRADTLELVFHGFKLTGAGRQARPPGLTAPPSCFNKPDWTIPDNSRYPRRAPRANDSARRMAGRRSMRHCVSAAGVPCRATQAGQTFVALGTLLHGSCADSARHLAVGTIAVLAGSALLSSRIMNRQYLKEVLLFREPRGAALERATRIRG